MYQTKIEDARALLTNHFNQVDEKNTSELVDSFFSKLKKAGGTTDEALTLCTFEDLESFGAPKLLAKQVASIFRKGNAEEKKEKKILKPSYVSAMSISELLEHYDPREATNAVGERISKIAGGKRCIVFNNDGTVNIKASSTLLHELRDNYSEREAYPVDGVPTKVYKVGERIGQLADENPLYPHRPLRPNGDCDQTNRSWEGISSEVRKIIYLAVTQTKEIVISDLSRAHQILDLVHDLASSNVELKIRQRYPKAHLLYEELKNTGQLPSMKISMTQKESPNNKNNPFFGVNKVV